MSHDENMIDSIPIQSSIEIFDHVRGINVIGVDEAQFFDDKLPDVCQRLAIKGARVIIAGLDMDFKADHSDPWSNLLAVAEYITKVHAICPHCGNLATHSYRLSTEQDTVLLGEKGAKLTKMQGLLWYGQYLGSEADMIILIRDEIFCFILEL